MPSIKDPIQRLRAHKERQAKLAADEAKLTADAAQRIGELALSAGLDDWSANDLKKGFARLAKEGAAPMRKTPEGARAAPPVSDAVQNGAAS